jgi:hypothetical protein
MRKAGKLAVRLAVCQILGTFAGVTFGSALSRIWAPPTVGTIFGNPLPDFIVLFLGGIVFGIPFYCVALLILHGATDSILRRPLTWCVAIPAALFAAALLAFPPNRVGGIFWVALIPLSALFAGALFCIWLRRSPLPTL